MTKVYDLNGNVAKEIELPKVFKFEYRPDVIQRAVLAIQNNKRQPYGSDPFAGKRTSAHYHGVKDTRNSMKNKEITRVARIHEGPPFLAFTPRFAPQVRKGREAHPPKAEKIWKQKINRKERIVALKSAIAATAILDLVKKRHRISEINLPLIVSDQIQEIKKTKDLEKIIEALKLSSDLERAKKKKIRAGKGKMRGRKYRNRKSFLIVVSQDKGILNSAKNLAGVDVCFVKN